MSDKPLISLCMIVGNVEEYIERCLESFKPIADEICIVRAIGNQKPDRTCGIAQEKFGARIGEYFNKTKESKKWPHVDSFAAARQQSFDMATGEYLFWCDTDDVLESGAEVVRELADRGGYAGFIFPYKILGRGMMVPRERMMLKGAGQWKCPVHEYFDFHIKPAQAVEDNRVIVKHIPHLSKAGSNERNLTILNSIPEKEMTCGLWYHMHLEREIAGDQEGSIDAARKALEHPDIGKAESYEIYLNLAQTAKEDYKSKHALLLQAYGIDPTRREALMLMCYNMMNFGDREQAMAVARQMLITQPPRIQEWNTRQPCYGWLGEDVYCEALRLNGKHKDAEIIRKARMKKAGGPRIALIHATRGRPERAAMARKMWLDQAEQPERIEHIFVVDDDDKESIPLHRMHHLVVQAGGGCVNAWNEGAFSTTAPVLVQMSDDWIPIPGWDDAILNRIGDVEKASVVAVSDGHREDKLLCMAIMTRNYWSQDWFMFHPSFTGVYSDNWFTDQAYARGVVIEARDIVFNHQHPAFIPGLKADETYAIQNSSERYERGKAVYKQLIAGESWSSIPGYCNYWPIYRYFAHKVLKDGDSICEVGVWLGRSITMMAQELKAVGKKVKIYAVDHFKGESNQKEHEATVKFCGGNLRAKFEENIKRCGVDDMIEIIDGDSAESAAKIADKSLAFCFIDAAHDYESVKRDIAAWKPKIKPGCALAGHDLQWEEVEKAVKESFEKYQSVGPCWIASIE